jgi:hypothetical protein
MFGKVRSFIRSGHGSLSRHKDLDAYIQEFAGLIPIDETCPEDVFIVGYPKSGNTWMQNLLSGLIYGLAPEYLPPILLEEQIIPDVHRHRYYRRFGTPMYFKSHYLPRPEYRRVIYLLRDGRDVMVSYLHYLRAFEHQEEIEFSDMVRTARNLFPCKWHEHVTAWQSNPYRVEMMTLKYEDLLVAPVQQLLRISEFLSITRPMSLIESVIEKSSFASMRTKEKGFCRGNPMRERDKFFVRRGVSGSYKDEMPQQVLDLFLADATDALRAVGYLS